MIVFKYEKAIFFNLFESILKMKTNNGHFSSLSSIQFLLFHDHDGGPWFRKILNCTETSFF